MRRNAQLVCIEENACVTASKREQIVARKMVDTEWDHERCKVLIKLYEEKPELWDRGHDGYHLKNKKLNAWKDIGEMLGENEETVKAKMTSLLSSYRREKARHRHSMLPSSGKDKRKPYKTKWFAFDSFQFLMNRDRKAAEEKGEANDDESQQLVKMECESSDDDSSKLLQEVDEKPVESKTLRSFKRKAAVVPVSLSTSKPDEPEVANSWMPKDENDAFGVYIASKLRKFNDHVRSIVMHRINNIFFDAEMGKFNYYYNKNNQGASASLHGIEPENADPDG